jgi:hypothetical protein
MQVIVIIFEFSLHVQLASFTIKEFQWHALFFFLYIYQTRRDPKCLRILT